MLNIHKLNTLSEIETYKSLLVLLDNSQPYALPDYFDVFCGGLENLVYFNFVSETSGSTILMPGYLKPIAIAGEFTGYFDFITPYGYSGPLYSSAVQPSDIKEFWEEVDEWYKQNNIVTEFVRFNLSGNHEFYSGSIFPTMLNIKGKILSEAEQWTSFDAKVRKNVNRAKRENLSSKVFHGNIEHNKIAEFHEIYIKTMKRTEAKEIFFYSLEQFEKFIENNSRYVAICTVYSEEIPISSELLLVSNDTIFSFLGGTDDTYFDKRPNDFLKVEALNWARIECKEYYVLGGGYGFEDGIFKYKKAFFPDDVVSYYTGRKILNQQIYESLVLKASSVRLKSGLGNLEFSDSSFFPLYNKPTSN